jgi:hypothetical protein
MPLGIICNSSYLNIIITSSWHCLEFRILREAASRMAGKQGGRERCIALLASCKVRSIPELCIENIVSNKPDISSLYAL